jgi:hypothetical protein
MTKDKELISIQHFLVEKNVVFEEVKNMRMLKCDGLLKATGIIQQF